MEQEISKDGNETENLNESKKYDESLTYVDKTKAVSISVEMSLDKETLVQETESISMDQLSETEGISGDAKTMTSLQEKKMNILQKDFDDKPVMVEAEEKATLNSEEVSTERKMGDTLSSIDGISEQQTAEKNLADSNNTTNLPQVMETTSDSEDTLERKAVKMTEIESVNVSNLELIESSNDSKEQSKQKACENTAIEFQSTNPEAMETTTDLKEQSEKQVLEKAVSEFEEMPKEEEVLESTSKLHETSKHEKTDKKIPETDSKDKLEEEKKRKEYDEMSTPDGKRRKTPELLKFWKAVEDDPNDFTGWTYLLQHADSAGILEHGREAYDRFLFRYPYCYGYWKKYADFEKRNEERESCITVFERGVQAIPLSADLWIHYLNHIREVSNDQSDFIRSQYERAVAHCGQEWRSDKLWDHYVKWETNLEDSKSELMEEVVGIENSKHYGRVLDLYKRILKNETQGLSHQFDMFRDFVKDKTPKQLLEINDFLALRKEVLESVASKKDKKEPKIKVESGREKNNDDIKENEVAPGDETGHFVISAEEENQAMRERIIREQKKYFKETEEKVQARWKYEDCIKRPYFHMKPLERSQLKNWNDYLTSEIKKSKDDKEIGGKGCDFRVEILFERCLIACALYEEFWIKYANWIKETDVEQKVEKLRNVYKRACVHHLPKKVDIHLAWAAFEEQEENYEACSEIYKNLVAQHPDLMSIQLNRIYLERRKGNIDEVQRIFKKCIREAKVPSVSSELSIKYARFLRLWPDPVNYDSSAAINVLEEALIKDEKNPRLYVQLLDIYLHSKPIEYEKIMKLFKKTLSVEKAVEGQDKDAKCIDDNPQNDRLKVRKQSTEKSKKDSMVPFLPAKERFLFSQRRIDFLQDFSPNINDVLIAQEEHAKLKLEIKPAEVIEVSNSKNEDAQGDRKKSNHSGTTYNAIANSATYSASHTNQYQQYGSRYNQHNPTSSYGSQYNNYYGQGSTSYGGPTGSTSGNYGTSYGRSY